MSEIRNLTRNGETFYPLTHVDAVIDNNSNSIGDMVSLLQAEGGNTSYIIGKDSTIQFIDSVNTLPGHTYLITLHQTDWRLFKLYTTSRNLYCEFSCLNLVVGR